MYSVSTTACDRQESFEGFAASLSVCCDLRRAAHGTGNHLTNREKRCSNAGSCLLGYVALSLQRILTRQGGCRRKVSFHGMTSRALRHLDKSTEFNHLLRRYGFLDCVAPSRCKNHLIAPDLSEPTCISRNQAQSSQHSAQQTPCLQKSWLEMWNLHLALLI